MMKRPLRYSLLLLVIFFTGCAQKLPVTTPIDALYSYAGKTPATTLIVFLPGISDRPETFAEEGFIKALRARNINADTVAVRAHFGYYGEHKIVARLHQDVIAPARAQGYKNIWLVGISLGGWGSVLYANQHADEIRGMLLLAPFLAEKKVFDEVQAAGGLDAWQPGELHPQDDQRQGLAWLRDYKPSESPIKVYLGYGASDRFAYPLSLFAQRLPAERVKVLPGGHDWLTWRRLWQDFLDKHFALAG